MDKISAKKNRWQRSRDKTVIYGGEKETIQGKQRFRTRPGELCLPLTVHKN
jgi:hypothetical protein